MAEGSGLRMPQHLVDRARSLVTGEAQAWEPPTLRDAATVVMVCDAADGLHIYLQRRVRTMAFAAGMYVFPGGRVDEADKAAARELVAAKPEQFEGTSIVLPDADQLGVDTVAARIAAVREVEEETSYQLDDPIALTYVAHWVTPAVEDRRYDTRFYAAVLDAEDVVNENSGESDAEIWLRPDEALAQYGRGEMAMLPPTVATLSAFKEACDAGLDAKAAIERLGSREIKPLLPSPLADPNDPSGVRWALCDVRTGEEILSISSAPAGSESGGVHTSTHAPEKEAGAFKVFE